MVLAVGEILFEFIPGTDFSPCISVVVFEMCSLISSLVVMRDREAGALVGTFTHASRFKYGQFKRQTGLRAVQKRFSRVSVTRTFVAHASPVKCDSVAHIKRLHVVRTIQAWQDYHESSRSMQWCIFLGVSSWKHLTCPTSRQSF